jgi:hypothetical protein
LGKAELSILKALTGPHLNKKGMSLMLPTLNTQTLFHTQMIFVSFWLIKAAMTNWQIEVNQVSLYNRT